MEDITRECIINHISQILDNSKKLKYKLVDVDEDINFLITFKFRSSDLENKIKIQCLLYCSDEHQLTIYCPTLFRLESDGSIMYILNAINRVNSKIPVGKIYVNSENATIISYINRILFNNIINELTSELFEDYLSSFIVTCAELYEEIKNRYEI